jgi:4-hydroxyphenylpyruvate dioxygenase
VDGGEILRIDHVGHAVRDKDFLSTSLFFRAMLGMEVGSTTTLSDPAGVVYSRVARNRAGTVRLPFSTTSSFGAAPRRFLETSRGAGIQQIAIQTADIFATARHAKREHVLAIGENYYADLAARFDLSRELLDQMRGFNILYDADANGAFLHFYFREIEGLFFEVLQRVGDYDRYGERNAPVRLAAQARYRDANVERAGIGAWLGS